MIAYICALAKTCLAIFLTIRIGIFRVPHGYGLSGGVGLIGYFVFVSVLGRSDYVQCVSEGDR